MVILGHNKDYLAADSYINWQEPSILQLAEKLYQESTDELELIKRTYHFVRDQIHHSWDVFRTDK